MMNRTFIKHCERCQSDYPNVIKVGVCKYCQYDNNPEKPKTRFKLLLCTALLGGIGAHHIYIGRHRWLPLAYICLSPLMLNLPLMLICLARYAFMSDKAMDALLGNKHVPTSKRHVVSR